MDDFLERLMSSPRRSAPSTIRPLIELLSLPTPDYGEARQTFEEEVHLAEKAFIAARPRGLSKADLDFDLSLAPANIAEVIADRLTTHPKMPDYLDAWHRVGWRMRNKNWLKPLDKSVLIGWLKEHGHDLKLFPLARFCSFAEIARFAHEQTLGGELQSCLMKHPLHMFVRKLSISAEHWGSKDVSWDELIKFHRLLTGFDVGLPGFEVTYDCTPRYLERGWSYYTGERQSGPHDPKTKPWLDGDIGLIISFNGEHVMTIGVAVSTAGLLVNQIQLLKKRGNRWLYKLPKPYFELMLERLHVACRAEGIDLHLVTGVSLSESIKRHYTEIPLKKETVKHIRKLYNQPLVGLKRSRASKTINGLQYRLVTRRP